MKIEEYKKLINKKKENKYHNVICVIDNIRFDSKNEGERYEELKLLEKLGKIKDLKLQFQFVLREKDDFYRKESYFADFFYYDNELNKFIVEDSKPFNKRTKEFYLTDIFKRKWKIVKKKFAHLNYEFRIV